MPFRIAVVHEPPSEAAGRCRAVAGAELLLGWRGEQANVHLDLTSLRNLCEEPLPRSALDLLDVAIGLFIADIAVARGERERWPREIELSLPVRDVTLWESVLPTLQQLTFDLTRDSFLLDFYPAPEQPEEEPGGRSGAPRADCVSMLSGGLDSLAGAVMLQQAGRMPLWSVHRSGNPSVRAAQTAVIEALDRHWPGRSSAAPCSVEPHPRGPQGLAFPSAEEREPSRRSRSLLFMALALASAEGAGVDEVFMCENGVLTAALPLAPSRAGSMSTHSTHPAVLQSVNCLAKQIGLRGQILNPFTYQTKGELLRDILAPHLPAAEIQSSVSCWMAGRAHRQCGGCVPCLLRRLSTDWAGLPEEAYMIDLLAEPRRYAGTDSYGNLMDLLRQVSQLVRQDDAALLALQPGLLALNQTPVEIAEVVAMLRRHAEQSLGVLRERYPEVAELTG